MGSGAYHSLFDWNGEVYKVLRESPDGALNTPPLSNHAIAHARLACWHPHPFSVPSGYIIASRIPLEVSEASFDKLSFAELKCSNASQVSLNRLSIGYGKK